MDIRRIRPDEADEFLHLLCGVFGLDAGRAQGIFYNEPMFDLHRKWALFEGGKMASILTTVPLEFGWGRAIGIAGVATDPARQGRGLASRLLEHVLEESDRVGEPSALLFAREVGLYQSVGFDKLDDVIRGDLLDCEETGMETVLEFDHIRPLYEAWSEAHPARLRRDDRRWKYWRWTLRFCAPVPGGYACMEGSVLRECVTDTPPPTWPVGRGADWFGLAGMADRLGIRLTDRKFDLHFMGYKVPQEPQMFMTDQF